MRIDESWWELWSEFVYDSFLLYACQTRELTEIYWNEIKLSSKFEPAKELAVKRERELQLSSHSHPRLRPDNLSFNIMVETYCLRSALCQNNLWNSLSSLPDYVKCIKNDCYFTALLAVLNFKISYGFLFMWCVWSMYSHLLGVRCQLGR